VFGVPLEAVVGDVRGLVRDPVGSIGHVCWQHSRDMMRPPLKCCHCCLGETNTHTQQSSGLLIVCSAETV
jgi:hypothetical protein